MKCQCLFSGEKGDNFHEKQKITIRLKNETAVCSIYVYKFRIHVGISVCAILCLFSLTNTHTTRATTSGSDSNRWLA